MVVPSNPVSQVVNNEAKRTSIPMGAPLLKSSEKAQSKIPLDRSQPDLISMMPHSARSIKSSHSVSSAASGKIEFDREEERQIILVDMDAYYAQVEIKKHNIDKTKPVGVQQWNSLIALNYVAKGRGIKRSMTVYEALALCPDLVLVHVSTFEIREEGLMPKTRSKQFFTEVVDHEVEQEQVLGLQEGFKVPDSPSKLETQAKEDSDSEDETAGHHLIESSICKTKMISKDENLEPYRRFWVEMR